MRQLTAKVVLTTLLALAVGGVGSVTHAGGIVVRINEPFVLGTEIYDGGQLAIVPVSAPGYLAVRLDGRQIALLYRHDSGYGTEFAQPRLVFWRDRQGLLHLDRIRYSASHGLVTRSVGLVVAAQVAGDRHPAGEVAGLR